MWKRHPLTRLAIAAAIALLVAAGIFLTGLLDPRLWADAHAQPLTLQGTIENIKPATYANEGRFDLVSSSRTETFEVNAYLSNNTLTNGERALVKFSPNLKHVYSIQILENEGNLFVEDTFDPTAWFQPFQTIAVFTVIFMTLLCVGATLYAALACYDWLARPRVTLGTVTARLEQADFNAGFGLMLRPLAPPGKSQRFYLNQNDFLLTDGAEFIQLTHSPVFNYIKQLRVVSPTELPASLRNVEQLGFRKPTALLHYLSRWQYVFFLFSDLAGAVALFSVPLIVAITTLPVWFEPLNSANHYRLYERVILPSVAMLALIMGIFLLVNFLRKWRDVRRPKKLTEGPVLSKWRVNGVSNENRRQIVVADGGMERGSEAVHKFDISAQIFDELKVGDVVKIEHTPRLRFILRLEVTGHQELVPKV